ncbi:hypothetical protein D9619_007829 [Psilocybe cf. subviscida]|uniref:methionyl-tRNA formyltransferase n=1 Tax=Psilocybe cf. subviscida TaxID=2480587 RepID=A0A8H5AUC8_9AGAR|nr:hypothetical protein D9619_007829 [Psilocybe cf. subviscida]
MFWASTLPTPCLFLRLNTTRRCASSDASNRFRILFMGRDEFSCRVLERLHKSDDVWQELTIATQPDVHVGRRGSVLSVSPLKLLGEHLGIPVHTIPKVKKEFRHWPLPAPFSLGEDNPAPPNHILVTASFGRILSQNMLGQFQPSCRLNVHPSLLPSYRGPAPIQHSIMNDEKETGVCVIQMLKKSEGIDAGAIWGCRKMLMPENATYPALRDKLAREGGDLLVSVLRDMLKGKATSLPQVSAGSAPKAPFIRAEDTYVDFTAMSADHIFSRFRALSHQKPLFTYTPNGKPLHLNDMVVVSPQEAQRLSPTPGQSTFSKAADMLLIRCAGGSVLGVTKVKPEGKADRPAGEFWNGVRAPSVDGVKHLMLGQQKLEAKL